MKKILCCILALLLCCSCAALAEFDISSAAGTITVWSPAEGFNSFEGKSWTDFMAEYPDVKVELISLGTDDTFSKIKTTLAAGTPEDLPVLNLIYDPNNIEAMTWDGVWEVLNAEPYNLDTSKLLDFSLSQITNGKGEVVALASGNTTMCLQFNRNIAREYFGTDDVDEIGAMFATLDDIMAKGKELAEKSNGEVFLFNCPEHVLRLGLGLTSDPFVVDGKLNIDESYGTALKLVEQAIADNSVSLQECWSPSWSAELQSDTCMFYLCPSWWLGDIKNNDPDAKGANKYGLITLPDHMVASWGGTFYFINAASAPEDKAAAYAWMYWLCCTPEGSQNWVSNNSQLTLCKALYDIDEIFAAGDDWYGGQPVSEMFRQTALEATGSLRQGTIYDSAISNAANQALLEMMAGATADEALQQIKDTVLATYPELG